MNDPKNDYRKQLCLILSTSTMLIGCSSNPPAPVFDLYSNTSPSKVRPVSPVAINDEGFYLVKPGDTLFSIAWYHSLDHQDLAQINQLKNNLIYPGQKLWLNTQQTEEYFDANSLLVALNQEVLNKPTASRHGAITSTIPPAPVSRSQRTQTASRQAPAKSRRASVQQSIPAVKKPLAFNRAQTSRGNSLNWIWPTDGALLTRFSNQNNASRGLDIAGRKGQPVRASAPGRVVYEGDGLKGYGNLVIIKHNNNYLSAYAHNDKVYVSENEVVKAGQRIADIGNSGTQTNKLHFEIRYKGKPVDPLNYLPEKAF